MHTRCTDVPWRVSDPNPTIRPDVETCRGASLPRGGFHATDLYPLHIYNMYISPTNNCHYHT